MKSQRLVAAFAAASLAFGSGAFAQSTGAQDQGMRENGVQNPNGPRQSPQQLREQSQAERANTDPRRQRQADAQNRAVGIGQPGRGDTRSGDTRTSNRRGSDGRGTDRPGRNGAVDRRDGHGAGPDHSFYRGDRLPAQYRGRQYVVDDWRGHRLSAPPRGYQWVQSGGDYMLVAIASGLIASILLNH